MAAVACAARPSAMVPRSWRLASLMCSLRERLSAGVSAMMEPSLPLSVDIALIAASLGQGLQFNATSIGISRPRLGQDTSEHLLDIPRHSLFIAADVEVGAIGDPAADLVAM